MEHTAINTGCIINTNSSEHIHTGGARAPITRQQLHRAPSDNAPAFAEHNGTRSIASTTQIAHAGPSSPPPRSRCSLAMNRVSPIPTQTGSDPPGACRASPPVTANGAGTTANAPHSQAATAPITMSTR